MLFRSLHFVSQPHRNRQAVPVGGIAHLGAKYGFEGKFFFLPNQFWSQKNHLTVFRALAILKAKGKPCQVICTGNLKDYRVAGDAHLKFLLSFINDQELESSVKILGLIDYPDVLTLCRHAVAVLNPSRFEGWSSTVEECKSLGKQIILADIPVHREQNPPGGIYFPWDDAETLAQKLNNAWEASDGGPNLAAEAAATLELEDRTRTYGQGYLDLIQGLLLRHRPG